MDANAMSESLILNLKFGGEDNVTAPAWDLATHEAPDYSSLHLPVGFASLREMPFAGSFFHAKARRNTQAAKNTLN
jgi:hypothetical protein